MHTLIESRIVPFDGHALWYPARESMKVNTLIQSKETELFKESAGKCKKHCIILHGTVDKS